MSALARAKDYVGLFICAEAQGHDWHYVAPVDGVRDGDSLRLGDTLMERLNATRWRVTADGESVVLALRTAPGIGGAS